jgi:hypothetical protein
VEIALEVLDHVGPTQQNGSLWRFLKNTRNTDKMQNSHIPPQTRLGPLKPPCSSPSLSLPDPLCSHDASIADKPDPSLCIRSKHTN